MAAVDKIFSTSKLKGRKATLFYFALQPFDSVIPPHPRRVKSDFLLPPLPTGPTLILTVCSGMRMIECLFSCLVLGLYNTKNVTKNQYNYIQYSHPLVCLSNAFSKQSTKAKIICSESHLMLSHQKLYCRNYKLMCY